MVHYRCFTSTRKVQNVRFLLADTIQPLFYGRGHKIGWVSSEYVCTSGAVNHSIGEDGYV